MYNRISILDNLVDTPKPRKQKILQRIFAEDFINLQGIPVSLKILTIVGYLAVFGQLLFTLLVELAGDRLPTVEYTLAGQTNKVPLIVMTIAGLAFILGWAYLLTGAATAGVRIFLPVLALFGLQLFLATDGNLPLIFLEVLFLLITLAFYGLTFRRRFWRNFPSLHFFAWLGATSIFILLSVGTAATNSGIASTLSGNFGIVLILTLAFWIVLSLNIIDLGIKIGRTLTRLGRHVLPFSAFSSLAVFVLLVHPAASALVFWLAQDGFWFIELLFSLLMILGGLGIWLARRWSGSTSAILLTLSLASPVVMLGVSLAFVGKDFTQLLLEMTGFFPPTLLFVGLTTYNLLGMGVAFTGVDGRILPKRARVLLYFGTLILVVASMLFLSNVRDAATSQPQEIQGLINNLFALSALVLGIPYLIWMVWKRREMLIGMEMDYSNPVWWPWLGQVPGSAWIAISLVLAFACSCVLLVILYRLI